MAIMDTIRARHSVREYFPTPIDKDLEGKLMALINDYRAASSLNNQHFKITLYEDGEGVSITAPSKGYDQVDLGIVKCNFEAAANEAEAKWYWV